MLVSFSGVVTDTGSGFFIGLREVITFGPYVKLSTSFLFLTLAIGVSVLITFFCSQILQVLVTLAKCSCPFDISVGVGAFVMGLGQISSFLFVCTYQFCFYNRMLQFICNIPKAVLFK